jgi:hypothetical protein
MEKMAWLPEGEGQERSAGTAEAVAESTTTDEGGMGCGETRPQEIAMKDRKKIKRRFMLLHIQKEKR